MQWLAKHPEYFTNPFYVTGNSYSGKVIPAIVQEISNGNFYHFNPYKTFSLTHSFLTNLSQEIIYAANLK